MPEGSQNHIMIATYYTGYSDQYLPHLKSKPGSFDYEVVHKILNFLVHVEVLPCFPLEVRLIFELHLLKFSCMMTLKVFQFVQYMIIIGNDSIQFVTLLMNRVHVQVHLFLYRLAVDLHVLHLSGQFQFILELLNYFVFHNIDRLQSSLSINHM